MLPSGKSVIKLFWVLALFLFCVAVYSQEDIDNACYIQGQVFYADGYPANAVNVTFISSTNEITISMITDNDGLYFLPCGLASTKCKIVISNQDGWCVQQLYPDGIKGKRTIANQLQAPTSVIATTPPPVLEYRQSQKVTSVIEETSIEYIPIVREYKEIQYLAPEASDSGAVKLDIIRHIEWLIPWPYQVEYDEGNVNIYFP